MIVQLNPPLPLETPKGKALAHFLLDYGPEADLLWICFQDETGECWTWPNPKIRIQNNISFGRTNVEKPSSKETSVSAPVGIGPTVSSVGQNWTMTQPLTERTMKDFATSFQTGYSSTLNGMITS